MADVDQDGGLRCGGGGGGVTGGRRGAGAGLSDLAGGGVEVEGIAIATSSLSVLSIEKTPTTWMEPTAPGSMFVPATPMRVVRLTTEPAGMTASVLLV